MIRNIVFDMGNVLMRFEPEVFLDRFGVTDSQDRLLLNREVFRSVEWVMTDRGTLTPEEAAESICRRLPERLRETAEKLICQWDDPILPMPHMEQLVRQLKEKGYRLYLLSNAGTNHPQYWPKVPGNNCFDGLLISADVHYIKPQPEIYRLLLEKFALRAEECIFVDDAPANVEGAVRCGISGIVFHGDVSRLCGELRTAGLEI